MCVRDSASVCVSVYPQSCATIFAATNAQVEEILLNILVGDEKQIIETKFMTA